MKVNIRVPLMLLRAGVRLASVIPPQAQEKVNRSAARAGRRPRHLHHQAREPRRADRRAAGPHRRHRAAARRRQSQGLRGVAAVEAITAAPPAAEVAAAQATQPVVRLPLVHVPQALGRLGLSLMGDFFNYIAMAWLVLQLTGSSLALGAVLMVQAVPRSLLMLVGGAMADRLSPRVAMAGSMGAAVRVRGASRVPGDHGRRPDLGGLRRLGAVRRVRRLLLSGRELDAPADRRRLRARSGQRGDQHHAAGVADRRPGAGRGGGGSVRNRLGVRRRCGLAPGRRRA